MKLLNIRQFVQSHLRSLLLYGGIFLALGIALYWQLGTLLPGYATAEAQSFRASMSLKALLDNPLGAPYYMLVKGVNYLLSDSLLATRVASTVIGLGILAIFASLLRNWYDRQTAVIGTLLFGLSAWFLHVARIGTPEVLLFGIFALAAAGFWLKKTTHPIALLSCFLLSAVLLYVPGMIWFIALGLVWQWKVIDMVFKKRLATVTVAGLVFLASLAPLAWALYKHHELIKPWLGLPHDWPTPLTMLQNLLEVPFHLLVRPEANALMWLGTAPIFEAFSLVAFIAGGYLYLKRGRLLRTPLFLSIFILTAALIAIGSPNITFTVVLPFMYIIIALGVCYLINTWLSVFPRNPIARSIGLGSIYLVIGVALLYHLTHYFIGWPDAQATHDLFLVRKL